MKIEEVSIPIDKSMKPVAQREQRVPFALEGAVEEKLEELLSQGIIEKVEGYSPWQSQIVPVLKKDKSIRICVNMKAVNRAVLKQTHPLPTTEQIFGRLSSAKIFSTLDIANAFHQVPIDEESRVITTFITHKGLFRYKRLMFGLSSAPEIFQQKIEGILAGLEGVAVFIDDILVFGTTLVEHDKRLKAVLKRLDEFGVRLNVQKCEFGKEEVSFLGHTLSSNGVRPNQDKIDKIMNWRDPKSKEEVRSLMGLLKYVGSRFVGDFGTLVEPMQKLMRQDQAFVWGEEQKAAFQNIKEELSKQPALGFYSLTDKLLVYADASPVAMGAILIQIGQDGQPRIISYASKSFSPYERKLSQTDKEAIALAWGCERFHLYLVGRDFDLMTDHKPLEVILGPRHRSSPRLERLQLRLQAYNYNIKYIPGNMQIADVFSRLCVSEDTTDDGPDELLFIGMVQTIIEDSMSLEELKEATENDELLSKVCFYI